MAVSSKGLTKLLRAIPQDSGSEPTGIAESDVDRFREGGEMRGGGDARRASEWPNSFPKIDLRVSGLTHFGGALIVRFSDGWR